MKKWFNSLEEDMRKKAVIGGWITTGALFLFSLLPSGSGIATFVYLIFTVALVFSIIFTKWNYSIHKATNVIAKEDDSAELEKEKKREEYLRKFPRA